ARRSPPNEYRPTGGVRVPGDSAADDSESPARRASRYLWHGDRHEGWAAGHAGDQPSAMVAKRGSLRHSRHRPRYHRTAAPRDARARPAASARDDRHPEAARSDSGPTGPDGGEAISGHAGRD